MNLEEIEANMKTAISWMLAHGSQVLLNHEQVLPIAHLFKIDGKSEIIGLYFKHNEEEMNAVADMLKARVAANQYVGALLLLLFNGMQMKVHTTPDKGVSATEQHNVLVVSYQTHLTSEMYVLPYDVSARGTPYFKKIEKMEPIPGNRFFKLFPQPTQVD